MDFNLPSVIKVKQLFLGITISNITPQKVFGIQFAVWFITVLPFVIAEFIFLYGDQFFDSLFYTSSCWFEGTSYENDILNWFVVDAFTRLALVGELIIFGIIMIVLSANHGRDIALVQKTFSVIILVFFLYQLAWLINAIVLIATVISPLNEC